MGEEMNIQEIENFINKINSVICSRIIVEDDQIKEIHVVSDMHRSPKQLSRDIQSILISKFNLDIDYKIISVAQIESEDLISQSSRLKLNSIERSINKNIFEAKVILEKNGELYEGTCSGPYSTYNIYRLLSLAVIHAVENFCGTSHLFVLEDVLRVTLPDKEAFVTLITTFMNGQELLLSGSAVSGRNTDEIVVKSALDAMNRVLAKLSRDYQTG